jgi:hypothetical protein
MEAEDNEFDSLCVTSLQKNSDQIKESLQKNSDQIKEIWSSRRTRRLPLKNALHEAVESTPVSGRSLFAIDGILPLPTVQEDYRSEEEDAVSQDDAGKGSADGIGKSKRSADGIAKGSMEGIAADIEPMVKKSRVSSKRTLSLVALDADGGGKPVRACAIACDLLGPFYILTVTLKHTFCVSVADNGLYAMPLGAPRSKKFIVAAAFGKTEDPMFEVVAGLENIRQLATVGKFALALTQAGCVYSIDDELQPKKLDCGGRVQDIKAGVSVLVLQVETGADTGIFAPRFASKFVTSELVLIVTLLLQNSHERSCSYCYVTLAEFDGDSGALQPFAEWKSLQIRGSGRTAFKLACGADHCVALYKNSKARDPNRWDVLAGLMDLDGDVKATPLNFFKQNKEVDVKMAAVADEVAAVLDVNGRLFTWKLGNKTRKVTEHEDGPYATVYANGGALMAVDQDGTKLFKLGQAEPKLFVFLEDHVSPSVTRRIVKVSVGPTHCAVVVETETASEDSSPSNDAVS